MSALPKVWLDADTGNEMDDVYALAHALRAPGIEVVGLSSAHFNNADLVAFERWNQYPTAGIRTVEISQQLNEDLLQVLGLQQLLHPIGADRQMGRAWGGREPRDSPAARQIIAAVQALPDGQRLDVLNIGALTNIASAIALAPSIAPRLVCYALGARYDAARGVWNKNEFNIRNDLNAFDALLDNPAVELVVMPLEAAAPYTVSKAETFAALADTVPLRRLLKARWEETNPQDETRTLWDVALVQAYLNPAWTERRRVPAPPENTQRLIDVYTRIDHDAMRQDFFDSLPTC